MDSKILILNKSDIQISNELMQCSIFWSRIVDGNSDTWFTNYTKHTFYELQLCLDGNIQMAVEDNDYVNITKSDFIIIPKDVFHQIPDDSETSSRFIMAFSISSGSKGINNALKSLDSIKTHHCSQNMLTLISLIQDVRHHDKAIKNHIRASLFEIFVLEMLNCASEAQTMLDTEKTDSTNQHRMAKIMSYIQDYSGIGLHVEGIAKKFNISSRHLNRIALSETGKTIKEIINYQKLKKIEELLASTSLTLYEISSMCGFSDEYAMNKFFKRFNAMSPSEYRRLTKGFAKS